MLTQQAFAQVVIKEVLYNPENSENTGEAVLLQNIGDEQVNVSNWVIATKTSSNDATLPQNTHIAAKGYLLIADIGFSLDKFNSSWPDANYEEAITLSNSNAGVALMNGEEVIDAVGWGNASIIGEKFYEGTPFEEVDEGESIRRVDNQDTNNNSADFYATKPIFYNLNNDSNENDSSQIIIDKNTTDNTSQKSNDSKILNYSKNITIKILEDNNSSKEGIQINPVANTTKTFEVLINIYNQSEADVESVKLILNNEEFIANKINNVNSNVSFKGNVSINYYQEPGIYNLTALIIINNEEYLISTEFELLGLSALTTDNNLLFDLNSGDFDKKNIILRNVGNEDLKLKIKATNIYYQDNIVDSKNLEYSIDNLTWIPLSEYYEEVPLILLKGNNSETKLFFKLNANENVFSGFYNGQIAIFYSKK